MAKNSNLKQLPIGLNIEMYEQLRQKAFDDRMSMAEIVRQALRKHLIQNKQETDGAK